MSHFFTFITNENGLILDDNLQTSLSDALSSPFNFSDIFIYSHGWWTSDAQAMSEYNRFSIEFARTLSNQLETPLSGLCLGIHWPSMLNENQNSFENLFELTSFYTMEKRADSVGIHGLYSLLRLIANGKKNDDSPPLRIHFIGHSFGCKVVCAALQEILNYDDTEKILANIQINVVLLQAAFDNNHLEKGDAYGNISSGFPNLRILITKSDEDLVLKNIYPDAEKANIFGAHGSRIALGSRGPTDAVITQFGGKVPLTPITVYPKFAWTTPANTNTRLFVADLTQLHQAYPALGSPIVGHHSDLFHDEIYRLITGFLF